MKKRQLFYLLCSMLLIYLIGLDIFNYLNRTKDPYENDRQLAKKIKCLKYGNQLLDKYLQIYTVKPGDSLSLIAKRELGNIKLIDEIIILNKDTYPGITKYISNFLIEPGWRLKLPIKSLVGKFHNELIYDAGLILTVSSTKIEYTSSSDVSTVSTLNLNENQNFPGKKYLRRGACVYFLYDYYPWPNSQNILEVTNQ